MIDWDEWEIIFVNTSLKDTNINKLNERVYENLSSLNDTDYNIYFNIKNLLDEDINVHINNSKLYNEISYKIETKNLYNKKNYYNIILL